MAAIPQNSILTTLDPEIRTWYESLPPLELKRILTSGYQLFYKPECEVAVRGGAGEDAVAAGIRDAGYRIIDTHKKTASGDFVVVVDGPRLSNGPVPNQPAIITVEVKNYSSPIPPAQLEKFRRDLKSPIMVDGEPIVPSAGLFVSLRKTIRREWPDYHFDVVVGPDGQRKALEGVTVNKSTTALPIPVIYLHSSDIKTIRLAIEDLRRWIRSPPDWITGDRIPMSPLVDARKKLAETRGTVERALITVNGAIADVDTEIGKILTKL